jgi:hypothetical protein
LSDAIFANKSSNSKKPIFWLSLLARQMRIRTCVGPNANSFSIKHATVKNTEYLHSFFLCELNHLWFLFQIHWADSLEPNKPLSVNIFVSNVIFISIVG